MQNIRTASTDTEPGKLEARTDEQVEAHRILQARNEGTGDTDPGLVVEPRNDADEVEAHRILQA